MKCFLVIVSSLFLMMSASAAAPRVSFKTDFCVCKDNQAVSYGNCARICSDKKTNGSQILFANFKITPNFKYRNIKEWCHKGKLVNRRCVISASDEEGRRYEMETIFTGKNSVAASVDMLDGEKIYTLRLLEQSSGDSSGSVQLVKIR